MQKVLSLAETRDLFLSRLLLSKRSAYAYHYTEKCACTTLKNLLWRAEHQLNGWPAITDMRFVHGQQERPDSPWHPLAEREAEVARAQPRFWFTFVRNPFARLLSAHAAITIHPDPEHNAFMQRLAGWTKSSSMTVRDFLELLASQAPEQMDPHWRPLANLLPLEDVGYDLIGAVETIQADASVLFRRAFPAPVEDDAGLQMYRTGAGDRTQALSSREVELILRIYQADFETFGYGADPLRTAPDPNRLGELARGGGPSTGALKLFDPAATAA